MEIIRIETTTNGVQTIKATDLYKFLEPKTEFSHWIKRMLNYGFVEGVDYWTILTENSPQIQNILKRSKMTENQKGGTENSPQIQGVLIPSKMTENKRGRKAFEYILSLDCAKSLAMVQRSEKGKQIRRYFIEVEKQFKAIATPQQIQELYNRLTLLENKQIDYADDWAIDRYLRVNKLFANLNNTDRQQLGKLCTKEYKKRYDKAPKKVAHPSYINGQNVYPYELINQVFKQWTKERI